MPINRRCLDVKSEIVCQRYVGGWEKLKVLLDVKYATATTSSRLKIRLSELIATKSKST